MSSYVNVLTCKNNQIWWWFDDQTHAMPHQSVIFSELNKLPKSKDRGQSQNGVCWPTGLPNHWKARKMLTLSEAFLMHEKIWKIKSRHSKLYSVLLFALLYGRSFSYLSRQDEPSVSFSNLYMLKNMLLKHRYSDYNRHIKDVWFQSLLQILLQNISAVKIVKNIFSMFRSLPWNMLKSAGAPVISKTKPVNSEFMMALYARHFFK